MNIVYVVLVGLCSGVVSGMGMGGGTLFIPLSSVILKMEQKMAQGINLLAFIPTAIVALYIHIKNRLVNFKVGAMAICAGLVSAISSAIFANNMDGSILRKIFGVFLLTIGIYQGVGTIRMCVCKKSAEFKFNFWYT